MTHRVAVLIAFVLLSAGRAFAQTPVFLEDLTWTEVRDAIRSGKTTVIVPTGGVEQNGPHMVLGKHNIIVKYTAGEIAKRLGDALVAPVVPFVPEGRIDPPEGHMLFAGTISLPNEYFMKILEFTARSLKVHGFVDIVFIGDSGENQAGARGVADLLNREWKASRVRVHHIEAYYAANGIADWLRQQGESVADIGSHASISDTSQLLALYPEGVRRDKIAAGRAGDDSGVQGNPTKASAEYGRKLLEMKIETGVRAIQDARRAGRTGR